MKGAVSGSTTPIHTRPSVATSPSSCGAGLSHHRRLVLVTMLNATASVNQAGRPARSRSSTTRHMAPSIHQQDAAVSSPDRQYTVTNSSTPHPYTYIHTLSTLIRSGSCSSGWSYSSSRTRSRPHSVPRNPHAR